MAKKNKSSAFAVVQQIGKSFFFFFSVLPSKRKTVRLNNAQKMCHTL